MPGLEFRYVGQDRLPARLSEFDVERYVALTDSDVAAVNERFRRDHRAGVAIQLVYRKRAISPHLAFAPSKIHDCVRNLKLADAIYDPG
jgi:hypothetical protein